MCVGGIPYNGRMSKPKVLVDPRFRWMRNVYSESDRARLDAMAEVLWAKDEPAPEAFVAEHADELVAILGGFWAYGEIKRFPKLKAFFETGGNLPSVKAIDYPHCFAHGIRIQSCAPAFGPFVAEMGLGLALSAARQIGECDRAFRVGTENWSHSEVGDAFSLYEQPVGLIGFGGLAQSLRPLLAPFRCRLLVHDPWLSETYLAAQGVTPLPLDPLLEQARVIFVLATPSATNKALLDRTRLERLRPDQVFVLLSRAHVVDFEALTELLLAGRFRAGIDVYPEEPLAADHPIREANSAVLTSHRAGTTLEALRGIGRVVVNDLDAVLRGLPPRETQTAQPEFLNLRGT